MSVISAVTAGNGWATPYNFQHKLFYAQGLIWAFYCDGTKQVYKTSADGTTWSAATTVIASSTYGHRIGYWFDGTYIHYAYCESALGNDVMYRRGSLDVGGGITWSAVEQTAVAIAAGDSALYSTVSVDSSGYAFIGYIFFPNGYPNTPWDAVVVKNSKNDGTWTTGDATTTASAYTTIYPIPFLVALTSGKMYVAYADNTAGNATHGRLWDGSSWGAAESTGAAGIDTVFGIVADGDNVHLVITENAGGVMTGDLNYFKRTYGVGWSEAETIYEGGAGNQAAGHINMSLRSTDSVIVFWQNYVTPGDHIHYAEKIGGSWRVAVDWIDEDSETLISLVSLNAFQASNVLFRGGLIYTTGDGSPSNVKFEGLAPIVLATVTTQAASSLETTSLTGNGNITNTGGENCTRRGFCYKQGTSGDPTTADNVVYDDGDFGTGAYTKEITGLSSGTSYRVRAYATNLAGTGYGDSVTVLTKPAAPTSVDATDGVYVDKVVITWTKSTGATDYHVWRDSTDLGAAGDVATFDDTGADAPTITAGTASASDGSSPNHVTLSLSGESANVGVTHTYKVVASNATGNSADSSTDTGYRGVGTLTYQWQRSAGDSDAGYSNISGGTTDLYNDTDAPMGLGRYYKCVLDATGASQATSTADRGYKSPSGKSLIIFLDDN